jgi:hypothetical protein
MPCAAAQVTLILHTVNSIKTHHVYAYIQKIDYTGSRTNKTLRSIEYFLVIFVSNH